MVLLVYDSTIFVVDRGCLRLRIKGPGNRFRVVVGKMSTHLTPEPPLQSEEETTTSAVGSGLDPD